MLLGESYYLEAVQLQGYGPWRIGIGAKIHNLSWTEDVADIDYEEQIINIRSTVVKETQVRVEVLMRDYCFFFRVLL